MEGKRPDSKGSDGKLGVKHLYGCCLKNEDFVVDLCRKNEYLRGIFESQDLVVQFTPGGLYTYVNDAFCETFGKSREELLGESLLSFLHPDDSDETLMQKLSVPPYRAYVEQRAMTAQGYRWIAWNGYAIRDEMGEIKEIQAIGRDITDRVEAVGALRDSEERYRKLVENSPDAIIVHCEGRVVFANAATAKILKLADPQQLVGQRVAAYLHKDYLAKARGQVPILLKGIASLFKEIKILANDGSVVPVESSEIPIIYKNKLAIIAVLRDVTGRKRLDEEILKASKLESIGTLAGGIAHDFNNILTIGLGNISLARFYADSGNNDALISKLAEIEKASQQAKSLVAQLQTFSRGGAPVKESTYLQELVREATALALSGSNIRSKFSFAKELLPVEVDKVQIMQVINNIVSNAIQAMPEGGTIIVRGENCVNDEEVGDYIRITFEDHGAGIPQEHIPLIFDPFFTTKPKGSGLGLATAYAIIQKHSGHISVESRAGVGTTFYVTLPAIKGSPGKESVDVKGLYKGKGKILVMDDEEAIRSVVGEILLYLGYTPMYAADGKDAVLMYREAVEAGCPFDAVIMDLTVPGGMGGKETIVELKKIDPGVKAIVSSGYSNDMVMANYSKYGFKGVVTKPYQIYELGRALHKVLGQK